jgi:diguanylate cyclase (GGDEF)-like protein
VNVPDGPPVLVRSWAERCRLPGLPKSLRGQLLLAVTLLSLLILAGGIAAVGALRHAGRAVQQLAEEQLARVQRADELLHGTIFVERETYHLLATESPEAVRASHARIVQQMDTLDQAVARLSEANTDADVLDLHHASQMFRSTAYIVAQLRETHLRVTAELDGLLQEHVARLESAGGPRAAWLAALLQRVAGAQRQDDVRALREVFTRRLGQGGLQPALRGRFAVGGAPAGWSGADVGDPFLLRERVINERTLLVRYRDDLRLQAEAMVAAARRQSTAMDLDYRTALRHVVRTSGTSERSVFALLASSLVVAWFIARVFLGRRVISRLLQVSRGLRGEGDDVRMNRLARGEDEIADMARAVLQFRRDRSALETRTTELSLAKELLQEQGRVLEMIAVGAALPDILDRLARLIEAQSPGIMASILLLDDDGLHLRHGAAPHLPKTYLQAVDGVRVGPDVGSCGTAVHRREPVIVTDIRTDPLWDRYSTVAAEHGLRSCWSAPIMSHRAEVLGTFALYSAEVRAPSAGDLVLVELATRIAGIAIERQRTEERIRHMAHFDELTGLPNRALLRDRLTQALRQAERSGHGVAVAFIDLDGFKLINDSLGHGAGDELLKAMAGRIRPCVRTADTVARLGGDEFVVVMADPPVDPQALRPLLQRIIEAVARPVRLAAGCDVHVSCSLGLAMYPADGQDADVLLAHADEAMYRAKQQGRNNYQFFRCEKEGREGRSGERLVL